MVSRVGSVLLEKDAIDSYKKLLIPQAELITPNINEAIILSGKSIESKVDVEKAAEYLISIGAKPVLIKVRGLKDLKGIDYLLIKSQKGE